MNAISARGYEDRLFHLIHEGTGEPVCIGERITDFRGDEDVVESARPPHKPEAAGYVNDFYASVFGLKWIEEGASK